MYRDAAMTSADIVRTVMEALGVVAGRFGAANRA
jgi:hypothetical protein